MSLINQMLQDLEKRKNEPSEAEAAPLRYAQYGSSMVGNRYGARVFFFLLAVLVLLVGLYFLRSQSKTNLSQPMQQVSILKREASEGVASAPAALDAGLLSIGPLPLMLKMSPAIEAHANSDEKEMSVDSAVNITNASETVKADMKLPKMAESLIESKLNESKGIVREPRVESHAPVVAEVRRSDGSVVELPNIAKNVVDSKRSLVDEGKQNNQPEARIITHSDKHGAPAPLIIKEVSPQQRAEGEFKQATIYQQQGRNAEAVLALEQALRFDPTHAPARQLMISLFLENKRYDEAIRELRAGLATDTHQINFAMILARLLVERAKVNEAVEILQKSVVYAQERPDYLAFLAALQQKLSRHKEAIQSYRLALAKHAQNAVWWMGLGISLQADGANQEALEAYRQAKTQPGLGADLVAYVDQKIAQIQK